MIMKVKGNLTSNSLVDMKTFLEYLVANYPTNLNPSGNAKSLKTFFSFDVVDIDTMTTSMQDLIGKYPKIEIGYIKKQGV